MVPDDGAKPGAVRAGVRSYVAFAGGIDVPLVLGSRSTYIRGRLGGVDGRALKRDDVLRLAPARGEVRHRVVDRQAIVDFSSEPEIRVVLGPQADRFTDDGVAALLGGPYEMLPQSDRMGARLRGARIEHTRGHDIISDGIPLGGMGQVTLLQPTSFCPGAARPAGSTRSTVRSQKRP